MRSLFQTLLLLPLLTFQGCGDEDCNLDCFTPPAPFVLEIVDKYSGENLFSNGAFSPEDIVVENRTTGRNLEFSFISENGQDLLVIHSIGWETEIVDALVSVGTEDVCSLFVDAERLSENCCAFTRFNEVRIGISEHEKDPSSDLYRIFFDTGSVP